MNTPKFTLTHFFCKEKKFSFQSDKVHQRPRVSNQTIPNFLEGSYKPTIRGVHLNDRVGSGRVLFDLVVFQIDYFLDACYVGSQSG